MEHPCISDDPCLESIYHLEEAIHEWKRKGRNMLVVMIPCADKSLYHDTDSDIWEEKCECRYSEVYIHIEEKIEKKECDWEDICLITKHRKK